MVFDWQGLCLCRGDQHLPVLQRSPGAKHGGSLRGAEKRLADGGVRACKGEAPVALDPACIDADRVTALALHTFDGVAPELRDRSDPCHGVGGRKQ